MGYSLIVGVFHKRPFSEQEQPTYSTKRFYGLQGVPKPVPQSKFQNRPYSMSIGTQRCALSSVDYRGDRDPHADSIALSSSDVAVAPRSGDGSSVPPLRLRVWQIIAGRWMNCLALRCPRSHYYDGVGGARSGYWEPTVQHEGSSTVEWGTVTSI